MEWGHGVGSGFPYCGYWGVKYNGTHISADLQDVGAVQAYEIRRL